MKHSRLIWCTEYTEHDTNKTSWLLRVHFFLIGWAWLNLKKTGYFKKTQRLQNWKMRVFLVCLKIMSWKCADNVISNNWTHMRIVYLIIMETFTKFLLHLFKKYLLTLKVLKCKYITVFSVLLCLHFQFQMYFFVIMIFLLLRHTTTRKTFITIFAVSG